jgi:hypothetical protein
MKWRSIPNTARTHIHAHTSVTHIRSWRCSHCKLCNDVSELQPAVSTACVDLWERHSVRSSTLLLRTLYRPGEATHTAYRTRSPIRAAVAHPNTARNARDAQHERHWPAAVFAPALLHADRHAELRANSASASQRMPRTLWNPKLHHRVTTARHLSQS